MTEGRKSHGLVRESSLQARSDVLLALAVGIALWAVGSCRCGRGVP